MDHRAELRASATSDRLTDVRRTLCACLRGREHNCDRHADNCTYRQCEAHEFHHCLLLANEGDVDVVAAAHASVSTMAPIALIVYCHFVSSTAAAYHASDLTRPRGCPACLTTVVHDGVGEQGEPAPRMDHSTIRDPLHDVGHGSDGPQHVPTCQADERADEEPGSGVLRWGAGPAWLCGTLRVVDVTRAVQWLAYVGARQKPVTGQALVAQASVDAFDMCVCDPPSPLSQHQRVGGVTAELAEAMVVYPALRRSPAAQRPRAPSGRRCRSKCSSSRPYR
jgi:hypothetical protein